MPLIPEDPPQVELSASRRRRTSPRVVCLGGGTGLSMILRGLKRAAAVTAVVTTTDDGGSSGRPSETALVADTLALYDKLAPQHKEISVVGRSLGSGVAVQLAAARPVTRLVLVTPYDSLQEVAAQQFPYFPVRWLLLDKFESWKYVPQISAPTLVIAAEYDEVIPRASTEALFARFPPGAATSKIIAGAGHNTISESAEYASLLKGPP